MFDLGRVLKKQKKLDTAEPLLRQALAGQEAQLGAEDEATLASVDELASLLEDQAWGVVWSGECLDLDSLRLVGWIQSVIVSCWEMCGLSSTEAERVIRADDVFVFYSIKSTHWTNMFHSPTG